MLEEMINCFANYKKTCSITNVRSGYVTFARDGSYLKYLYLTDKMKDVWVIVPWDISTPSSSTGNIKYYHSKYPEYEFTLFHNEINKMKTNIPTTIGQNCNIHPTVITDIEGIKLVYSPEGKKIQFKHTGGVEIGNDVSIAPYTVVHRGTMENTVIGNRCVIGALNNIGHNCIIGKDNTIVSSVNFNGGVKTGKNCWFGSGAIIKTHLTICDNVVVGMGAVVTKDIIKSGIYIGNPARYLKPMEKGWNF